MKQLCICLLFCIPLLLSAQSEDIQSIRSHYQEVQKKIKEAKDPENPGGLYCNTIKENVFSGSWRATGQYKKEVEFWYDDVPGFVCEEFGGDEACHLQFITMEEAYGYGGWATEFLFENGKLVFCYMINEAGPQRYYWKDGKLIRAQIDDEIQEGDKITKISKEDAAESWKTGMKYRQQYIDLF